MSMEWAVAIGISVAGLVISIVTLINVVALRRAQNSRENLSVNITSTEASPGVTESGNVFCRGCGSMYDSAQSVCPSCHTPRG
jgi:uncharacterized paraquat-inducible protein A